MLEREARRKYKIELTGSMVLYAAVLFASIHFGRPLEPGVTRTLVLVSPVIPLMLAIWAIARQFGRMDEFVRLRNLENFAVAGAVTAGLSFSYGFLESAGFPKLTMFLVWTVMGITWGLVGLSRCLIRK